MNDHTTYALIAVLAAVGILSVPDSFAQNVDDAVIDIEELGKTQIPLTLETDMDLYTADTKFEIGSLRNC